MMNFKTIMTAAFGLMLCACSQDLPNGPADAPDNSGNGIYSKISFRFPGSTRAEGDDTGSTTANPTGKQGEEVGQDYENKIGSILVVMTDKTTDKDGKTQYEFISSAINDAPLTSTTATQTSYTITFQDKEALFKYAGKKVYVFAFCNPTEEIRQYVLGSYNASTGKYSGGLTASADESDEAKKVFDVDKICISDISSTWTKNGFLMTSVEIIEKELGSEEELKMATEKAKAFNLGTVQVIRTMSRFDFRDAAKDGSSTNDALTYSVIKQDDTKAEQGKVKFTRVALFNVADKFYYLPRIKTSETSGATTTTTVTVCPGASNMELGEIVSAPDRGYSYTISAPLDPTAVKTTGDDNDADYLKYKNLADLSWSSLEDIIKGTQDNETGAEDPDKQWTGKDYRIWTYASENTFDYESELKSTTFSPSDKVTGYVFEAEITPAGGAVIGDDGKPVTMYLYGETLYKSADDIYNAVVKQPVSTLSSAFNHAFDCTVNADGSVTVTEKTSADGTDLVKNNGFVAYKPTKDGKYLSYYFAYNKHNDDGNVTTTGSMEFGTVRNNVYKLAITGVKKFGTFEPSNKVEDWDTYFDLNVEVRNWTVRVNNIEF